jgi:hypothetical protein
MTARFRFNLVNHHKVVDPTGHLAEDRAQALAMAERLAIDIAETRKDYLGKGYFVSVLDQSGQEVHRVSIDSAKKSG